MKPRLMRYLLLVIATFLLSFVLSAQKNDISREEYIATYAQLAMDEMKRSGVPASITLAQGCLESSNGNSMLAKKARNHFGIKCHKSWTGKKIYKDDDKKNECFRVYKTAEQSYIDHSDFLKNGQRYAFLFDLKPTDYKGWAKGLRKAGYATNPKYPTLLIKIIEDNELHKYDLEAMGKGGGRHHEKQTVADNNTKPRQDSKPVQRSLVMDKKDTQDAPEPPNLIEASEFSIDAPGRETKSNNGVNYIVIEPGDTFYSLSKEYELGEWQLHLFNDFEKEHVLKAGEVLYLQTKKRKASKKYTYHAVRKGDSLHSISQLYAIRLKKLRKLNGFSDNKEVSVGDKVKLRP